MKQGLELGVESRASLRIWRMGSIRTSQSWHKSVHGSKRPQ